MATMTLPRVEKSTPNQDVQPLLAILEELDLMPFQISAVHAYKRDVAVRERKGAWVPPISARGEWGPTFLERRAYWRSVPLADYQGVVPEFVQHKASLIKERDPNVELFVDQMEINETRHPDPFLVAYNKANQEVYYLEVWDERDFERGVS